MHEKSQIKSGAWKLVLWGIALAAVIALWYVSVVWQADRSKIPSSTGITGVSDQESGIELARRIIVYRLDEPSTPVLAADA